MAPYGDVRQVRFSRGQRFETGELISITDYARDRSARYRKNGKSF